MRRSTNRMSMKCKLANHTPISISIVLLELLHTARGTQVPNDTFLVLTKLSISSTGREDWDYNALAGIDSHHQNDCTFNSNPK